MTTKIEWTPMTNDSHERHLRDAAKLGALQGAAQLAVEYLTNPKPYVRDPIESALYILRLALEHDGSSDFYERRRA